MVRHAPIHRRSGHSDIAICCGRNVRGSSPSTSVVPLSNQVTTLNHKRFKGFKMFSDGHLGVFVAPISDLSHGLPLAASVKWPELRSADAAKGPKEAVALAKPIISHWYRPCVNYLTHGLPSRPARRARRRTTHPRDLLLPPAL